MLSGMLFIPGGGIVNGADFLLAIPSCALDKEDAELRPGPSPGDIFAADESPTSLPRHERAEASWNR